MTQDDFALASGITVRRCACRGVIAASDKPNDEIPTMLTAVEQHQNSDEHRSWDLEAWVEANTAKVDVPIATLRKIA